MNTEIHMKINEQEIRLNGFVQKALSGVIEGFISSLDKLPEPIERIEISLNKRSRRPSDPS